MRTTLDLSEALIDEARAALGTRSKTDTIEFALRDVVRRKHLADLKSLLGRVRLDVDLAESRRRPGRPRKIDDRR
jgi:Arc/MetJ family transcription regulator